MTAHALTGDREWLLAAGMDDYLAKPVRAGELATVLATCAPLGLRPDAAAAPHLAPVAGPAPAEVTPVSPGPEPPALDPAAVAGLQELPDCGPAAIAEIGGILLDYAPPVLACLRGALDRGAAGEVARSAHALKGSAANAAALRLAALCKELELLGKAAAAMGGVLVGAEAKLAAVEAEWVRVKAEIEEAVARAGGTPDLN